MNVFGLCVINRCSVGNINGSLAITDCGTVTRPVAMDAQCREHIAAMQKENATKTSEDPLMRTSD
jgi:hypothetical protein